MANIQKPYGFRPVADRTGGAWVGATRAVIFAGDDSAATFVGDLVKFTGTEIEKDGVYYSEVTRASAGDQRLAGAVVRFHYPETGYDSYNAASTGKARIAYIPQDPNTLYVAQENGDMGADAVESNANFVVGTGSTVSGFSGSSIASSTKNTTATLPLRIVSRDLSVDNEAGPFSNWYVTINQNAYTNTTGL